MLILTGKISTPKVDSSKKGNKYIRFGMKLGIAEDDPWVDIIITDERTVNRLENRLTRGTLVTVAGRCQLRDGKLSVFPMDIQVHWFAKKQEEDVPF